MPTTNTNNCFVLADSFNDFSNPFLDYSIKHRGAYRATMQVNAVRRVAYNQPSDLFAWVRESSVDASTDHRTVILHCVDVPTPSHLADRGSKAMYARTVFAGMMRSMYRNCFRAEDQVDFAVSNAVVIARPDEAYVRILSVEDLS